MRRARSAAGRRVLAATLLSLASAAACSRKAETRAAGSATASASALPAPIASGVPIDPKAVSEVVNPDHKPAYSGPSGSVRGRIVATGDAPYSQPDVLAKIPASCGAAPAMYEKVFREGPERALADVLVAVTGYDAYLPAREPVRRLVASGCSFGTKTVAVTLGQRIDVTSGDREAYVPELLGERTEAQIVAVPGGKVASSLYPTRAGRFVLVDDLRLFMTAEVLVLKYSTVAVTGTDGRYEISGIPVGTMTLSAILPATGRVAEQTIQVEAGKATSVDLAIPFDAAAHRRASEGPRDGGSVDAGKREARPKPVGSSR